MCAAAAVSSNPMDPDNPSALVDQAARSVKWSLLYNTVPRLVTPFCTMILAALLTPVDFGLVAIATFVTALALILVDLGLGKAVIQRQTSVHEAASTGLWVSVSVSVVLYLALWVIAPWIGAAYDDARVIGVIRVAALALPLMALASHPEGILVPQHGVSQPILGQFIVPDRPGHCICAVGDSGDRLLGSDPGATDRDAGQCGAGLGDGSLATGFPFPLAHAALHVGFQRLGHGFGLSGLVVFVCPNAIAGLFLGVRGLGVYSLGFSVAILVPGFLGAA